MPIFNTTIGFILVFAGCHIPWFFAGSAGFLLGNYIGITYEHLSTTRQIIINNLQYGVLSALFSLLHKRLPAVIGGALHGAYLVYNLPLFLGWNMDWFSWHYYLAAMVVGILLVIFLNIFGMMAISTFSGAILIMQNNSLGNIPPLITLVVLVFLGFITQFILLRHYQPPREEMFT